MMIFTEDQDQPVLMTDDDGTLFVDLGDGEVYVPGLDGGDEYSSHLLIALFDSVGDLHTFDCRRRHPNQANANLLGANMLRTRRPCAGGEHCANTLRARFEHPELAAEYAAENWGVTL